METTLSNLLGGEKKSSLAGVDHDMARKGGMVTLASAEGKKKGGMATAASEKGRDGSAT